jgi:hypothetical protein
MTSAELRAFPAPASVPGREEPTTLVARHGLNAPGHNESSRITINRLDVQIVNQASAPTLQPAAPASPSPADAWETLDRHHLGNDGLML